MSISINDVVLQGRLAQDPQLSSTAGGTAVARFTIATDIRRKNSESGQYENKPTFNRVACIGKTAETVGRFCMQGKEVYVKGELVTRSWEQGGERRYATEVEVIELKLGADPKGFGQQAQSQPQMQQFHQPQQQRPQQPQTASAQAGEQSGQPYYPGFDEELGF